MEEQKKVNPLVTEKEGKLLQICNSGDHQYAGKFII